MISVVFVLIVIAGGVSAVSRSEIAFKNDMESGSVQIALVQYEMVGGHKRPAKPGVVAAGQKVSYIPEVTNLRADSYVRVSVDIQMKEDTSDPITMDSFFGLNDDWVKRGGYFYYTKPLVYMESSHLFEGIDIPNTWKDTASFKVSLRADAIQASGFEPDFDSEMPWGSVEIQKEKEYDGIKYGTAERAGSVKNKLRISHGSKLESNTENLFDKFNYYMAGNTFSDTLELINESEIPMKLKFCTDVRKSLLTEKAELEIWCDGESFYKGPLCTEALTEYIDLTDIPPGEIKDMDFKVTLPKDAGNMYSVLKDDMIWKFSVEQMERNSGDRPVRTGDTAKVNIYVILAMMSAAVAVRVFKRRGR